MTQAEANINNGCRVTVSLPDYEGVAGFVDRGDGTASLSYRPRMGARALDPGAAIDVAGAPWEVVSAAASDYVKGFRVLTLKRIEAGA